MAHRDNRTNPPALLPPKLNALGAPRFTPRDHEVLSMWLAQDGWPRGTMNMESLEGYLVALLVWPVAAQPGLWLPLIWGEVGWKVPAKIASQDDYDRFVALVVGFLVDLDRGLRASPPDFAPLHASSIPRPRRQSMPSVRCWAQGFLKGLGLSARGLRSRSDAALSAVTRIARCASSSPMATGPVRKDALAEAVLTLTAERTSRGPLGALPKSEAHRVLPHADRGRH